jgi:hypothetical protein
MAGFYPFKTEGNTAGQAQDFIIANSQTISAGEMVRLSSGFINTNGATNRALGVCIGFVKDLGNGQRVPLDQDAAGSVTGTRSGNAGVIGSDTYAAAADNQTVDKVMARVIVDKEMEYYNDASDTLTTAHLGTYFDINAGSDQVDVATQTGTYSAVVVLTKLDPHFDNDVSKGIFKIVEHQWD